MSQDEFTKLFNYMQKRFDAVDTRLEDNATKKQFNDVMNSVDGLTKQILDYHQEMLMLVHKVDRMERWIHEIADKTGVKLSYE